MPLRTCIGCRRVAPPDELVRVVAGPDGGVAVGRDLPGRGAWLCAGSPACVELAVKRKAFARALRVEALQPTAADRARIEGSTPTRPAGGERGQSESTTDSGIAF